MIQYLKLTKSPLRQGTRGQQPFIIHEIIVKPDKNIKANKKLHVFPFVPTLKFFWPFLNKHY